MKWSIAGLVVLGFIAAASAVLLMNIVAAPHRSSGEATILVARTDLPGNTMLEASCLEEKKVRREDAPEFAVTAPTDAISKIIKEPVVAGQPIVKTMFVTDNLAQLVAGLKPGERAVAISLSDFAGLEGVLYPGSVVDVVLTVNSVGQAGKSVSKIVVENVPVLAIERQTIVAKDAERQQDTTERRGQNARRVTLKVSSQQATELSLAQNAGTLTLALRNPSDRQEAYKSPISLTSLLPSNEGPSWLKSLAAAAQANASAASKVEANTTTAAPAVVDNSKKVAQAEPQGWSMTVIRGSSVETVQLPPDEQNPSKVVKGE